MNLFTDIRAAVVDLARPPARRRDDRVGQVDRQDLARLQSSRFVHHQRVQPCALGNAAPTVSTQGAEMHQDVAIHLVADEKPEAPRRIEPLHRPGHAENVGIEADFAVLPLTFLVRRGRARMLGAIRHHIVS